MDKEIHSEINKETTSMVPTVNISPLLAELHHDEHFQIGILTSNTQENVKQFLDKNELGFFDFIRTGKSVFGKSHIINKIVKQRHVSKNKVFYVCDEMRDIEAARKSGIKSIAVTWGYNTKDALIKENPDFLVSSPDELRNIIIS